jgi:hypothetical protein
MRIRTYLGNTKPNQYHYAHSLAVMGGRAVASHVITRHCWRRGGHDEGQRDYQTSKSHFTLHYNDRTYNSA